MHLSPRVFRRIRTMLPLGLGAAAVLSLAVVAQQPGTTPQAAAATLVPASQRATGSLASVRIDPSVLVPVTADADIAVVQPYPFDSQGRQQFTIVNLGEGAAGPFHVAVLALAHTYGFVVSGLAPHAHITVPLQFTPDCGQSIIVIADVGNRLHDADPANNLLTFYGACDW